MNAPVCPVSRNQPAPGTRVGFPTLLPVIPVATDLPSLIRAVNIINDVLRTLTTSLTVNNIWQQQTNPDVYIVSAYPNWAQSYTATKSGFIFYKAAGKPPDKEQRAYVIRTDSVEFVNTEAGEIFTWSYAKDLDLEYGGSGGVTPFVEDFFERVINVKWGAPLAVEFLEGSA